MRSRLALYQTLCSVYPSLHCARARIQHSYDLLQSSCVFPAPLCALPIVSLWRGVKVVLYFLRFYRLSCFCFQCARICSSELFSLSSFSLYVSFTFRGVALPHPPLLYSCILYRLDTKSSESSEDALSVRTHRAYYYIILVTEMKLLLHYCILQTA